MTPTLADYLREVLPGAWQSTPDRPTRRVTCLTEWPPLMARPRVPRLTSVLALLVLVGPYDSGSRITFVDG